MNTSNNDGITDMSSPDSDTTSTVELVPPQAGAELASPEAGAELASPATGPNAGAPGADSHGPRTRWAAVIWGVVLAALAAGTLSIVADPGRREGFVDWLVALSPAAIAGYVVLAIGAFLLVAGIVGIARRLQRRSPTATGA
jgi:hypothetical protein